MSGSVRSWSERGLSLFGESLRCHLMHGRDVVLPTGRVPEATASLVKPPRSRLALRRAY